MNRIEKMPVPVLPTFVGALTLSNVYAGMGYTWIRHITMFVAIILILAYCIKIVRYPKTCIAEYQNVVPCSLYAGFTMIMMILGSYIAEKSFGIGKNIWFAGLILHGIHILIFTWRNVIKSRKIQTFLPSWFVTYNGIMVSCVVGGIMQEAAILKWVVYYGIFIYLLLIPIMIWRLLKHKVGENVYHTMAVVLAPCSLCVVSYLNVIQEPKKALVFFLYGCVLLSLGFVLYQLPKFFGFSFHPGFAGMTFPMAIGIVATNKMAAYTQALGYLSMADILKQLSGIQIYITSMLVGFVLLQFLRMFLKTDMKA